MNDKKLKGLVEQMRDRRERIFAEVADAEDDLRWIAEDRESELEERAQEERAARLLARLDDRGKQEIEAIDEALRRVSAGTYGVCEGCGGGIAVERLEALPATPLCIECAREDEAVARQYGAGAAAPPLHHPGRLPVDASEMSDSELETWLRELVREDGRVDMEELRLVCRHGVVHLEGALPSEAEHHVLLGLVQDVAGMQEVDDRLDIREVLWEREDRSKPGERADERRPRRDERALGTEDVVESIEEGITYAPPVGPTDEEE
ncbi:MAG: TraR/DksA C4-type zinc finger protein [Thermodesulfobacteriota bacterium]